MRIFVTGASGYVGPAVVRDMLAAGHEVIGLARSDESEAKVRALGAEPLRGDIADTDGLIRAAEQADAVAHLAFNMDLSRRAENSQQDAAAIAAFGKAFAGTDKPLVTTSGLGLLLDGELLTENVQRGDEPHAPRNSEAATFKLLDQGVKAMVVRLPQVNGPDNRGFVPMLIRNAREKGYAAYIGDGSNRWPAGHLESVAQVYRLAIEKGRAGHIYHAVAEEGVTLRDITVAISEETGLPLRSIAPEEAEGYFGWFAMFAGMDNPSSSVITQAELGWKPSGPTTLESLRNEGYL